MNKKHELEENNKIMHYTISCHNVENTLKLQPN